MKRLLLSLAAAATLTAAAQDNLKWALTEPKGGETVLMERVGFLLASDNDDTFSIVCTDGHIIGGASEVTFSQVDPTAIDSPKGGGEAPAINIAAGNELRITSCAAGTEIAVIDGSGRRVAAGRADGATTAISIAALPQGVYILKAGKTSVKFMKK